MNSIKNKRKTCTSFNSSNMKSKIFDLNSQRISIRKENGKPPACGCITTKVLQVLWKS